MQNAIIYLLAIMNVGVVAYIIYTICKNNKRIKEYRSNLKPGDIVRIKNESYPASRIVSIAGNEVVVSLIVPKDFVHPLETEIVDDFD